MAKKRDELSSMIDSVIQGSGANAAGKKIVDIITFCEDARYLNFLGQDPKLKLWPMQRIVLKLFYRGSEGNEHLQLTQEEIDVLEDIAEREDLDYELDKGGFRQVAEKYKRGHVHNQLLMVMGRRSSKTMLVSIIAAYEAYKLLESPEGNPHKKYNLSPDKPIAILNVAVSEKQAYDPLFKEIQSRIARSPFFSDKINHGATTKDTIYLLTDADKRENALRRARGMSIMLDGSVVLKSGHSNSASLRGQAAICVLFDEFAHFMTSSGKQSGDEVYNALVPSTRQFGMDGKVVLLSDPRDKDGMFWKLFEMSQVREVIEGQTRFLNEEILALQLPTWRMNPNVEFSEETLKQTELPKDPVFIWTTWNARFQGEAGEHMFDARRITDCIVGGAAEPKAGDPRYRYYIHLDPAKTSHNYALVMVHVATFSNARGEVRRKAVVDVVRFWRPTRQGPVSLSTDVEPEIWRLCRNFRVQKVTFDSFQSAQMIEHLRAGGIRAEETPFIPSFIDKIYTELKNMINEVNMVLPPNQQLIGELRCIKEKIGPRGIMRAFDKNSDFRTDDCCDALAGATFQALNDTVIRTLPRSAVVRMGIGR